MPLFWKWECIRAKIIESRTNVCYRGSAVDNRIILHSDMNSFFASVETLYCPELRDVPMAVCGSQASRSGIVLAKNNLAKAAGVKTAEAIWQAKEKCPELVMVSPHYERYSYYSAKAFNLLLICN